MTCTTKNKNGWQDQKEEDMDTGAILLASFKQLD